MFFFSPTRRSGSCKDAEFLLTRMYVERHECCTYDNSRFQRAQRGNLSVFCILIAKEARGLIKRGKQIKGLFRVRTNKGDSLIYFLCFFFPRETGMNSRDKISSNVIRPQFDNYWKILCVYSRLSLLHGLQTIWKVVNKDRTRLSRHIKNSYLWTKDPRNIFTFW